MKVGGGEGGVMVRFGGMGKTFCGLQVFIFIN